MPSLHPPPESNTLYICLVFSDFHHRGDNKVLQNRLQYTIIVTETMLSFTVHRQQLHCIQTIINNEPHVTYYNKYGFQDHHPGITFLSITNPVNTVLWACGRLRDGCGQPLSIQYKGCGWYSFIYIFSYCQMCRRNTKVADQVPQYHMFL